jgi:hypothetical protein
LKEIIIEMTTCKQVIVGPAQLTPKRIDLEFEMSKNDSLKSENSKRNEVGLDIKKKYY